jgi:predicted dehydrogenase
MSEQKILKGAIIGAGYFAHNHLNAWSVVDGAEIIAICDRDEQRANAACAKFAVSGNYQDAAKMFEELNLDFIDICTTMETHRDLVELAASYSVPVKVQKPIAPNWEDAKALVTACKAAGVPIMVHENFRFQMPHQMLAKWLRDGRIGKPTWGRIFFRTWYDIYENQPYLAEVDRLALLDLGVHVFDLARVYFGEPETLYCQTQTVKSFVNGEDQATALVRHKSGAVSVVECTYGSCQLPDPIPQTLVHLEGTEGSIKLLQDYKVIIATADGAREEHDLTPAMRPWACEPWHCEQDAVVHTIQHFVDGLNKGGVFDTSGEDNLRTFAMVMAAYDSAASGKVVHPSDYQ